MDADRATAPVLLLASGSPRRRELLAQIGVGVRVLPVDVDETPLAGEGAEGYVRRLALEKARAGWEASRRRGWGLPALGADTAVVIDGEILGKPADRRHAARMLARLGGRAHRVLTAVALAHRGRESVTLSASEVRLRPIEPAEAGAYWDSGEPADKAGGYAIQGLGAVFVERLEGSYSGVVGLPLYETAALLRRFSVPLRIDA